jgi:hypothetical protein
LEEKIIGGKGGKSQNQGTVVYKYANLPLVNSMISEGGISDTHDYAASRLSADRPTTNA